MKTAALFFGSGISIPSGLPSVQDISDAALNGKWRKHTDQNFYPTHPGSTKSDPVVLSIQSFLGILSRIATEYPVALGVTRISHYEDWFSLAEQVARLAYDFTPNLATVEFLRRLKKETEPIYAGFKDGIAGLDAFSSLADETCDYLHCVVYHELTKRVPAKPVGMQAITEIAAAVDTLDIFTLNHDCLVETQLQQTGVSDIELGFDDQSHGDFRVYSGWSSDRRSKVRLFKLHGSLNWYLYDFPGWARQYAIPKKDIWHGRNEKNERVNPIEGKAAFLSGTIVKEQRYGLGFWSDLFTNFRAHLSRHTHLICCGYGFGDMGINNRLSQWLADRLDGSNRLVILTPENPEEYLKRMPWSLSRFHEMGRIVFVNRYLEKCTQDQLSPFFDSISD